MATEAGPSTTGSSGVFAPGRARISAKTLRTDNWRFQPNWTALILYFFILYTIVRLVMNKWYYVAGSGYLTPVYSPCISEQCVPGASDFGTFVNFPGQVPIAILIVPILAGFRGTCYYYRKAGYRSLWFSPKACAVPEPHKKYTGETRFPLSAMNFHRYFGFGLGSLIMAVNVGLLWSYSLSCHAARHALGGRINNFSSHPLRYKMWTFVSRLNPRHGTFAMASLTSVIVTDAYIMAVSAGWISDLRFLN
ncbi:MAG: hypothetical protein P8Z68_12890 [Kineosporiaceae bacterium]